MINIRSGHPAIDRYLTMGYERVRGMSSRFSAAICGHLIRRQSARGINGDLVEIGTYEGRFFIAMALGLAQREMALAIDRFDWPDAEIERRFLANCEMYGIPNNRFCSWKADSQNITSSDIRTKLGNRLVRFVHIDGQHTCEGLANDLEFIDPVLHPAGVICVDDMLHPCYPVLVTAVSDYFVRHPEKRLLCIIDREDISAAPKFLICHAQSRATYMDDLLSSFSQFQYGLGADMETYSALVLTPRPRAMQRSLGRRTTHWVASKFPFARSAYRRIKRILQ